MSMYEIQWAYTLRIIFFNISIFFTSSGFFFGFLLSLVITWVEMSQGVHKT